MPAFTAAGIAVYALSYDEADALRDFRDAHGITYTLLSDPQSEVIKAFGLLHTLLDAHDHPWFGIPYPGTYVMDAQGVITEKFFDNNLAVRAGPEQLLRAAQGRSGLPEPAGEQHDTPQEVEVSVQLDGDSLAATVQRDLLVQFSVPEGRHVYAHPAPAGSVAVDVVLDDNSRVVQRPIHRPVSEAHTLQATGESFRVHHGTFVLRLPITVNQGSQPGAASITLSGEVRWQSCDDEVCDIPARQRFELELPLAESPPVALFGEGGRDLCRRSFCRARASWLSRAASAVACSWVGAGAGSGAMCLTDSSAASLGPGGRSISHARRPMSPIPKIVIAAQRSKARRVRRGWGVVIGVFISGFLGNGSWYQHGTSMWRHADGVERLAVGRSRALHRFRSFLLAGKSPHSWVFSARHAGDRPAGVVS